MFSSPTPQRKDRWLAERPACIIASAAGLVADDGVFRSRYVTPSCRSSEIETLKKKGPLCEIRTENKVPKNTRDGGDVEIFQEVTYGVKLTPNWISCCLHTGG